MRIVSLVPSLTESLFDLGLTTDEVVGRTKFCIHPEGEIKKVQTIGGTKNLNIDKIKSLAPDLILANKEENVKEQVEELMQHFCVDVDDTITLTHNDALLRRLGKLIDRESAAEQSIEKIHDNFRNIPKTSMPVKTAYLIWKKPYMTVGGDTFIHHMMERIGLENIFGQRLRYPAIEIEEMAEAELILLSSEPYPFKQKHADELQAFLPGKKILTVDGEAFSWFGTHIAKPNYAAMVKTFT
ncbi:MAG: cobalamin-binding protein [Chryseobacterium sp.]|nr:MAG: cobalamin-binding protein [Chryseobacterium sp.]